MEFGKLILELNTLKNTELPGIEAHKKLAPFKRPVFKKHQIPTNAKQAGVLVLLYPDKENNVCVLLIKRAKYNGTHSHQISLPGGKYEPQDGDLQKTALRETLEEVGVAPQLIHVFKQLTTIYVPPSNFSVNPYLGILKKTPKLHPNYEVEEVIQLPLSQLLDKKNTTTTTYAKNKDIPCFVYKNNSIWGATAMILNEVKELLKTLS